MARQNRLNRLALGQETYEIISNVPNISQTEIFSLLQKPNCCEESWRKQILKPNVGILWNEHIGKEGHGSIRNKTYTAIKTNVLETINTTVQPSHPPKTKITPLTQDYLEKTVKPKWEDAHISLVFRAKHRDLYAELEQAAEYNFRTLENEIFFRLFRRG